MNRELEENTYRSLYADGVCSQNMAETAPARGVVLRHSARRNTHEGTPNTENNASAKYRPQQAPVIYEAHIPG